MMQAHPPQFARINTYHGPKKQVLGNQAGHAAPAWRANQAQARKAAGPSNAVQKGSKILMSCLPLDVGENEVEGLFTKTIGPLKETFLVYNSQGRSKGVAVVTFQRPGDAALARLKYNGKMIDGRRPIRIEIVQDEDIPVKVEPKPPTLLERLGTTLTPSAQQPLAMPVVKPAANPPPRKKQNALVVAPRPVAPKRMKKGPKRLKKAVVTVADLDKEMEDYRANAVTS